MPTASSESRESVRASSGVEAVKPSIDPREHHICNHFILNHAVDPQGPIIRIQLWNREGSVDAEEVWPKVRTERPKVSETAATTVPAEARAKNVRREASALSGFVTCLAARGRTDFSRATIPVAADSQKVPYLVFVADASVGWVVSSSISQVPRKRPA